MVKWFLQIWRNLMNVTNVTSSNCHRSIYHGRSFSKVFSRKSGFTFTVDLDPKILRKLNIRILQVYICQWLIANRLCRSTNLTTIGILHNFRNSRNSQSIKKYSWNHQIYSRLEPIIIKQDTFHFQTFSPFNKPNNTDFQILHMLQLNILTLGVVFPLVCNCLSILSDREKFIGEDIAGAWKHRKLLLKFLKFFKIRMKEWCLIWN